MNFSSSKFIFVRVPKTGTTSMIGCLPNLKWDLAGWVGDVNHIPLWFYKEKLPKDIYDNYFKFSFVRNPYDRAVSSYIYTRNWFNQNDPDKFDDGRLYDFKSWLNNLGSDHKYGLQYNFVQDCDFIGKFENLQEDFNIVCNKIGVPYQKLPHKNKSNRKHYREYYDDEIRSIVAKKYAKDIETFGYEF